MSDNGTNEPLHALHDRLSPLINAQTSHVDFKFTITRHSGNYSIDGRKRVVSTYVVNLPQCDLNEAGPGGGRCAVPQDLSNYFVAYPSSVRIIRCADAGYHAKMTQWLRGRTLFQKVALALPASSKTQ